MTSWSNSSFLRFIIFECQLLNYWIMAAVMYKMFSSISSHEQKYQCHKKNNRVNMTHKWFLRDVIYFSYFSRYIPFQIKRYLLKELSICWKNGCLMGYLWWLKPGLSFSYVLSSNSKSLRGTLWTWVSTLWRITQMLQLIFIYTAQFWDSESSVLLLAVCDVWAPTPSVAAFCNAQCHSSCTAGFWDTEFRLITVTCKCLALFDIESLNWRIKCALFLLFHIS